MTRSRGSWFSLSVLAVAALVDRAKEYALSILWPFMFLSLDTTLGQLGSLLGASRFAMTVSLPVWGLAVDRFSRKKLLVAITSGWGLWTVLIALVQNLPQLMLINILVAVGLSLFAPAAFSLLSDLFDDRNRGRAAGIVSAMTGVGIIVAYVLLPALARSSPEAWRTGYAVIGVAGVLSGLLLLLVPEPLRGASESPLQAGRGRSRLVHAAWKWSDVRVLFHNKTWWLLVLSEALEALGIGIFFGWAFTLLEGLGLGSIAALVVGLMLLGSVVGALISGWLGDRLEQWIPQSGRVVLVLASLVLTPIVLVLFLTVGPDNLTLLTILGFLYTTFQLASGPSVKWPIAQAVLPPALRGTGAAAMTLASGVVAAPMLTFSGYVADALGVTAMLLWLIPLPALLAVLAWLPMFRTYPHDRAQLEAALAQQQTTG